MDTGAIITQIVHDKMLQTMLAAVVVDLVLGVAAAFKDNGQPSFALAYVANFARNDLLGKVVPWAAIEAGAIVAGGTDIVIPGFDMNAVATASGAVIVAALVGSILGSLKDLGLSAMPAALGSGR